MLSSDTLELLVPARRNLQQVRLPDRLLTMGVDIGQKRDPTAIAVTEIVFRRIEDSRRRRHGREECHFIARFLERLPLGTPYTEVARRVSDVCTRLVEQTQSKPTVFVDATGVGAPIVDLLKEEVQVAFLWAVYFTHGDRRREERDEMRITLGKAFLVSRLQALLQRHRLHLPDSSEARALAQDLLDYEIRVDHNANDRYGAFRTGTHDDLATALGLAVQREARCSLYPGLVVYGP